MKIMKKSIVFLLMFGILFISFMNPIASLAKDKEDDSDEVNKNDADVEIQKDEEDLEEEIDEDTKEEELDTHDGIKVEEGAGSFYDAYEDEINEIGDTQIGGEIFVKLMKDFDYNEQSFDCNKFDILCHMVNLFFVASSSIVNFMLQPLSKLAISPDQILGDAKLTKFQGYFDSFTYSLLSVFILFQIIKIYTFRMTNHADTINVMNDKIVKIAMACILLFSYTAFFKLILAIQYRVNYGIFSYLGNAEEVSNDILLNLILTGNGITFVIMVLVYALLIAVLFFQMTYTFALISLYYVVGPVAIVTMVNDEYNMFSTWFRTIISRFLTLALQGLTVVLSFSYASSMEWALDSGGDNVEGVFTKILALSFLIVGISIPSLLKEFGNSSGSGKGAMSATQSVSKIFTRK